MAVDALGRRGQANVVSLMILISVTLALAVALYAYFTGMYGQQAVQQSMLQVQATYATSIIVNLQTYSNASTAAGARLYCGVVSLKNIGGQEYRPYVLIIPGAPGATTLIVESSIERVPLDYAVSPPRRDVMLWFAKDFDQDGIVDMVAGSPGAYHIALNRTANCTEIYNNATLKSDDLDPQLIEASRIIVDPATGLTLLELVKQAWQAAPDDFTVPAWPIPLRPGELASIQYYVESPVNLNSLTLVVLAPFGDQYLVASYIVLFSG